MSSTDAVRINIDQLPVGGLLTHPMHDAEGNLLLAAGTPITKFFKEQLLSRGIDTVLLNSTDAADFLGGLDESDSSTQPPTSLSSTAPRIAELNARVESLSASVSLLVRNSRPPLSQRVTSPGCVPYDAKQYQRFAKDFSATIRLLNTMVQQALSGVAQDAQLLTSATANYISDLTKDADHIISSTTDFACDPRVTERGAQMAILAMAVAIEMGLDEPNVREVGLCGFVHDWGMFKLTESLRDLHTSVSANDWSEIELHPLYTAEMLDSVQNISDEVRLAATQVHENADGSGYPRGQKAEQIHPYARILHVVDAYITLTAEMRGRQAFLAYDVMVYLLHQVKIQRMNGKATRALLNVISLFPIGSFLQLSDGTEAQVIRRSVSPYMTRSLAPYMTPIVQRVGADEKISAIDLANSDLRVTAPLSGPGRQEVRLKEDLMEKILWEGSDN